MSLDECTLQFPIPSTHLNLVIPYDVHLLSCSSSLKRKRSEEPLKVMHTNNPDAHRIIPIVFPSVNRNTDNAQACPPSPAPTEIVDDVFEEGDVCMDRAKAAGVKVRDFAHEPLPKGRDPRAPELWKTPLEALIMHDHYIRVAPRRAANYRLPGKHLHRLLALGWVTQEEAEFHWRDEDWKAMSEYTGRPLGAYPFIIPKGAKKPTAAYRASLRLDKHVPAPDDLPEEKVFVPPDVPDMDDGPARVDPEFLRDAVAALRGAVTRPPPAKSATNGADSTNRADPANDADSAHVDKRRRLSDSTPTASAAETPLGTPPASATPALARTPSPTASSSRPSTPPASPRRLRRGRGGLARTQTFGVIA